MGCATRSTADTARSAVDQLIELGFELNANHYRVVHLAARYDEELDWLRQGLESPAAGIANRLQIHTATAREWIRVGHSLRDLPLIDAAFGANEISYAKARILTRWADPDNEAQLLTLAENRTANRLTTAIAQLLAIDEDDESRDQRHHAARSLTSYTDGDGMVVIRIALPPTSAKPVIAAVEELVRRIAQTPIDEADETRPDPPASASLPPTVTEPEATTTACGHDAPAGASEPPNVTKPDTATTPCSEDAPADTPRAPDSALSGILRQLSRRWQPDTGDSTIPSLAQQRADAFAILFLDLDIALTTEVIIHVRGDGNTFNDGTPITTNAIARQLDDSFIRLLIHDAERRPVNASSRRRHPTTRQKRVVMETHHHECVDCARTDLLELDHNPPYHLTRHTITTELEPRCAPCHRARHRTQHDRSGGHLQVR